MRVWTREHTQNTQFVCNLKDTNTRTRTHSRAESRMALQGTGSATRTSLHQRGESFAASGSFEVISGSVIKRRYGQMHLPFETTPRQPWGYLPCVTRLCDRHTPVVQSVCFQKPGFRFMHRLQQVTEKSDFFEAFRCAETKKQPFALIMIDDDAWT